MSVTTALLLSIAGAVMANHDTTGLSPQPVVFMGYGMRCEYPENFPNARVGKESAKNGWKKDQTVNTLVPLTASITYEKLDNGYYCMDPVNCGAVNYASNCDKSEGCPYGSGGFTVFDMSMGSDIASSVYHPDTTPMFMRLKFNMLKEPSSEMPKGGHVKVLDTEDFKLGLNGIGIYNVGKSIKATEFEGVYTALPQEGQLLWEANQRTQMGNFVMVKAVCDSGLYAEHLPENFCAVKYPEDTLTPQQMKNCPAGSVTNGTPGFTDMGCYLDASLDYLYGIALPPLQATASASSLQDGIGKIDKIRAELFTEKDGSKELRGCSKVWNAKFKDAM